MRIPKIVQVITKAPILGTSLPKDFLYELLSDHIRQLLLLLGRALRMAFEFEVCVL